MKLLLLISLIGHAHAQDIFKDLRTYYNACGLVGKDDPRFERCNPPHMPQIMENFKKDPKNVQDMKKIARFHMTHSLQAEAKSSLKEYMTHFDLKKASRNQSFVIASCGEKSSLDMGQNLKNPTPLKLKTIKETLDKVRKEHPCPRSGPIAFAVGVVDETGNPDAWMIDRELKLTQLIRSTGKTPFDQTIEQ